MTGHRPWSEVRAAKARHDAARGRVPQRSLVTGTSFTTESSSAREHVRAELGVLVHPDVDVDVVRLGLIEAVMAMNRELNAALDPDRFIYTRGPHEGEYSDGEHVCVPECYEDQVAALERAEYVDPRPEYRVIAEPWYDHEGNRSPDHPDGAGHDSSCAAGYSLEVWTRHPDQPPPLGAWSSLGATQTDSGGRLDRDEVVALVTDYVETLAHPVQVRVDPARVHVYVEVT